MPPRWNKFCTLWLLAALAVIAINMLTAYKAHGQSTKIVRAPLMNFGAITTCDQDNNPVIVVAHSVTPEEYGYVIIHEHVHVSQMQKHQGGCNGLLEEYRTDPKARLRIEGEAYCGDFNERVKNGMPASFIVKLAAYLHSMYPTDQTVEEVQASLPCGKEKLAPRDGTAVLPP